MIRGHSVTVEQSFNFMFKWFPVTAITAVHFSVAVRRTVVPPPPFCFAGVQLMAVNV